MNAFGFEVPIFRASQGVATKKHNPLSLCSRLCSIPILIALSAAGARAATIAGVDNTPANAQSLVNALLGPGITLVPGSIALTGVNNQQGSFTNGAGSIGISSGIVLTTGNANQLNGSNAGAAPEMIGAQSGTDSWSLGLGTGGDTFLNTLTGGFQTFDANVLTFNFQFGNGSTGGDVFFTYVFASEEYLDYVGTQFNDVFAFLIDGVNVATIGSTPITINNINPNVNSAFYRNNVANTHGFPVLNAAVQADGFTTLLTAQRVGLGPGTHTMSFRVADTSDGNLDAAVFLQGGSFSTVNPTVPEPSTWLLTTGGAIAFAIRRKLMRKDLV